MSALNENLILWLRIASEGMIHDKIETLRTRLAESEARAERAETALREVCEAMLYGTEDGLGSNLVYCKEHLGRLKRLEGGGS